MYLVCPAFLWLSTAFQTLLTQGQVVSTTFTPLQRREKRVRGVTITQTRLDETRDKGIAHRGQGGTQKGEGLLSVKELHFLDGCSEGGQDDHVSVLYHRVVLTAQSSVHQLDVHLSESLIDLYR